jgi:small subunit ribosomal protein S20
MANIKSSKQDILINKRNAARNSSNKNRMKTYLKKAYDAIENKAKNSQDLLHSTIKMIDKAIASGCIHKRNGARKKSKLALRFNSSQK